MLLGFTYLAGSHAEFSTQAECEHYFFKLFSKLHFHFYFSHQKWKYSCKQSTPFGVSTDILYCTMNAALHANCSFAHELEAPWLYREYGLRFSDWPKGVWNNLLLPLDSVSLQATIHFLVCWGQWITKTLILVILSASKEICSYFHSRVSCSFMRICGGIIYFQFWREQQKNFLNNCTGICDAVD